MKIAFFEKLASLSVVATVAICGSLGSVDAAVIAAQNTASGASSAETSFLSVAASPTIALITTFGINFPFSSVRTTADQTNTYTTAGINDQTVSWGTTNGNASPLSSLALFTGGGAITGNSLAKFAGSEFGWSAAASFAPNPSWTAGQVGNYIATGGASTRVDSMFLYFSKPIAGFSALFDYNPARSVTVTAYSSFSGTSGTIDGGGADTTTLPNSAGVATITGVGNIGTMLGFLDTSPDISVIQISGSLGAMANLVITYGDPAVQVPEPLTLAMLGSGLVVLGLARRRVKKG